MKKSPSPLEKAGWGIGILNQKSLILETVDWSRNTTGTVHECLAILMNMMIHCWTK